MSTPPAVSVVVPTHNRKDMLHDTLGSLAQQSYPSDRFEVVVVDDGSADGTRQIETATFPFALRYFRQANQGDVAARNLGARESRAPVLAFVDDDVLLDPGCLAGLVCDLETPQDKIVVGTAVRWPEGDAPLARIVSLPLTDADRQAMVELPFVDVCSNCMALRREAYFRLGMMQGLGFPGSDMWCDVDLAYRAYRQGFEFRRCTRARYRHRDHAIRSLDRYARRIRTAAYRAVALFTKFPELPPHLPMFRDKTPIAWGQDPPRLMARKLARHIASSPPALWGMERLAHALEKRQPEAALLLILYRVLIGGYVFQGYRAGLRELAPSGVRR